MKVKYAERGTFDSEKAAKALMELTNRIRKLNIHDIKPESKNDKNN